MRVHELIEKLRQFDPDADICVGVERFFQVYAKHIAELQDQGTPWAGRRTIVIVPFDDEN